MQAAGESAEAIQVQLNFEAAAAAVAAVQEVYGEDHRLLKQDGAGASLWDELKKDEADEPHVFEGEDALIIKHSLEEIGRPEADSAYRDTARMILKAMAGEPLEWTVRPPGLDPVEAPRLEPAPRRENGEIVAGHVALGTFEHLVTALKSVESVVAADDEQGQAVADKLRADIQESDPLDTDPVIYWGSDAQVVYNSLVSAAKRRETLHDDSAAYMLEASDDSAADSTSDGSEQTGDQLVGAASSH